MGLFDDIVHAVTSPVEHLIGKTATNVLFPAVPISHIAANLADRAVGIGAKILTPAGGARMSPQVHQNPPMLPGTPPAPNQPIYLQPYAPPSFAPYFQPQYYPPPQEPQFTGGSPWDFSTRSQTFFPTPSVTYSAPSQDRTWEDLLGLAPLLLL